MDEIINKTSRTFQFWIAYLGYNFQRVGDDAIFTKGQLLNMAAQIPNSRDLFEIIPYEPPGGWRDEAEESEHFRQVSEMKKTLNV